MAYSLRLIAFSGIGLLPTLALAQAPAPLPPRIQIRANVNGAVSRSVQISGQQRKITVTQNGETIAIEDTADKNITLKRTKTVNGEKKTETFQAPDVETLKKNHPEAAELYKKHTEEVGNAALLQQKLANGGFFGPGAPAPSMTPRRGHGSRQLMSSFRGKTIEIEDQYGENIVVRITEKGSPEPKVRKIEAKDLAELTTRDAEAAEHYQRLTTDN